MIFYINGRFEVDTEKNIIVDKSSSLVHHLENRLMAVLRLLINANGEIVKREQIILDVWNNYPGGDEGLNQAISHLRKYFADDKKELIKTIPKKGYIFMGTIKEGEIQTQTAKTSKLAPNKLLIFLLLTCLFIISFLIYQNTHRTAKETFLKNEGERARLDSIHQAETLKKYEDKK